MNNIITLQKNKDGDICCKQITLKGKKYLENIGSDEGFWEKGGTILLDEIEEILNKEVFNEG